MDLGEDLGLMGGRKWEAAKKIKKKISATGPHAIHAISLMGCLDVSGSDTSRLFDIILLCVFSGIP